MFYLLSNVTAVIYENTVKPHHFLRYLIQLIFQGLYKFTKLNPDKDFIMCYIQYTHITQFYSRDQSIGKQSTATGLLFVGKSADFTIVQFSQQKLRKAVLYFNSSFKLIFILVYFIKL